MKSNQKSYNNTKVNYTKEGRGGVLAEEVFVLYHNTFGAIVIIISTIKIIVMQGELEQYDEQVATFLNNWMNGVVAGFLQVAKPSLASCHWI